MARATWGFPGFGIRGRAGGLEFVAARDGGTIVREVPTVRAARTPLQRESEARLRAVAAAWAALPDEDREAWARWVENPLPALPQGGGTVPMQPYNAFSGLAAKCLQMRPGEPVPSLPPATPFLGDGIVVSLTPSPTVPPCTRSSLKGEPSLTFYASGPNSQGAVTELLAQPLARLSRKPSAKGYRTREFVAFAAGSLAFELPVEAGAWALAVRFVRANSGQETAVVPIGKVSVGA